MKFDNRSRKRKRVDNLFFKKLLIMNKSYLPNGIGWCVENRHIYLYIPGKNDIKVPKVFKGKKILITYGGIS